MIRSLARDVAAICAGGVIEGLAFGALASAAGLSLWMTVGLSLFVFAGGSQFLAVASVAAGANPWMAVLGGLLINARHIPFGLVMATVVGDRWRDKLVGAHLLTDEAVAFSRAQDSPERARIAYWLCGAGTFITWSLATFAGAWIGDSVPDPQRFGVDAAFPAALFALLLPSLRGTTRLHAMTRRASASGAAIAIVTSPFLPPGLPVLTSLAGLLFARNAGRDGEESR